MDGITGTLNTAGHVLSLKYALLMSFGVTSLAAKYVPIAATPPNARGIPKPCLRILGNLRPISA